MRFFSVALLGLASVAAAEVSSWNDIVGDVPQCMKTCLNDFYNDSGLDDKCGSADKASVDCLCGVKDTQSSVKDLASDLSSCIQDTCEAEDLAGAVSKLNGFQERFNSLADTCSEKGAASITVPGFSALLASGALMLVGAAL